jgi:hypothetical protein
MAIKDMSVRIWIGFKWIRTGTSSRLLTTVIKFGIKQNVSGTTGEIPSKARTWATELVC